MHSPKETTRTQSETLKRRREWLLILLAIALVVFLSRLEVKLFDLSSQAPLGNTLLVLSLINLNILLILLFLFLLSRNLFKLILERKRGAPGARLRSKLVGAFVALSLVPTMLLFFVSAGFITNSIENWFTAEIEASLEESLQVAQTYYQNSAANALYYADQLALTIKDSKLLNEENLPALHTLIKQKQQEYNLGMVEIFSATHEELVRAANPQLPSGETTPPDSDDIRESLQGNRFTRINPVGKADLIRGIVPVRSNWNPDDVVGVVVVPQQIVDEVIAKAWEKVQGESKVREELRSGKGVEETFRKYGVL